MSIIYRWLATAIIVLFIYHSLFERIHLAQSTPHLLPEWEHYIHFKHIIMHRDSDLIISRFRQISKWAGIQDNAWTIQFSNISVSHNTAKSMKANEKELCKRIQSRRKFVAGFNFHQGAELAIAHAIIKCYLCYYWDGTISIWKY